MSPVSRTRDERVLVADEVLRRRGTGQAGQRQAGWWKGSLQAWRESTHCVLPHPEDSSVPLHKPRKKSAPAIRKHGQYGPEGGRQTGGGRCGEGELGASVPASDPRATEGHHCQSKRLTSTDLSRIWRKYTHASTGRMTRSILRHTARDCSSVRWMRSSLNEGGGRKRGRGDSVSSSLISVAWCRRIAGYNRKETHESTLKIWSLLRKQYEGGQRLSARASRGKPPPAALTFSLCSSERTQTTMATHCMLSAFGCSMRVSSCLVVSPTTFDIVGSWCGSAREGRGAAEEGWREEESS